MPLALKVVLGIFLELLATKNYGHHAFQKNNHATLIHERGYHLGFAEFDDEGRLFDSPESMDSLIDEVAKVAQGHHSIIVVFVHGWHHNAAENDPNLTDFKDTLEEISQVTNNSLFLGKRSQLAGAPKGPDQRQEVIGIYLGWRGRSEPGFVDYTTFWSRKAAAQRIGTGAAADLLTRLDRVYKRLNQQSIAAHLKAINEHAKDIPPLYFTGMVVVGHSFGGALVLSAVENQFQAAMAQVADDVRSKREATFPVISGLGDLVVLVNPAIEASLYEEIFRASQVARFSPAQPPILLTVSADNDRARQFWFPTAQRLSGAFRATQNDTEENQLRRALGEDRAQVTHRLEAAPAQSSERCPASSIKELLSEDPKGEDIHLGVSRRFEHLSGTVDTCFFPDPQARVDPDNPFIVVRAKKEIINGHNDVFDKNFKDFLTDFIAIAQIKRQKLFTTTGAAATIQMLPKVAEHPAPTATAGSAATRGTQPPV